MKAIILAGGQGKRIQELTNGLPKQMALVFGDYQMKHLLDRLPESIDELVVVTGNVGGDLLEEYIRKIIGKRKVTFTRQEMPTGTAHALLLAKPQVENEERFVVMYGDDLHDKESIEKCPQYDFAMLVAEVPDPHRFGIVELDKDNFVKSIEEKPENPKTNLASCGFFVFTPEIFDFKPFQGPKGEYYLTSMLEGFIKSDGKIKAIKAKKWLPFNDPNDHKRVEDAFKKGLI